MKSRDIMSLELQWISSQATAQQAAQVMRDRSMGMLLVIDLSPVRLAGVLTDRDLATRVCAENKSAGATKVIDVASKGVFTCRDDDSIADLEKLMREQEKSRVVVLDDRGLPAGVISLTDIIERDRPGRAIKTARAVLAREAGGPHTPLDQIKLTPSTRRDEDRAERQQSSMIGGSWTGSMSEFPT
ncbi:MAG TPA: CBS domain-containing protein [Polyangia bacterium]|nr:CBS domain-containing protein [Polyangia bacterium]